MTHLAWPHRGCDGGVISVLESDVRQMVFPSLGGSRGKTNWWKGRTFVRKGVALLHAQISQGASQVQAGLAFGNEHHFPHLAEKQVKMEKLELHDSSPDSPAPPRCNNVLHIFTFRTPPL